MERGIYHYAVREHGLELIQAGDFRAAVTQAGLGQGFLGQAGVCFVLSAPFQRTRWKYAERSYIRARNWDYVAAAFGLDDEGCERLRAEVIRQYGAKNELIVQPLGERQPRGRRRRRRK